MSYQVLALKYRPRTFNDVVGQNHVTTTLNNAISSDRVAHAILFTGPRGTGKTTIARILARAMNCVEGPTPTPCNNCKICKDIIQGHCTDVFEIDGASNNSVDQIRDLRENVTYMPSSAKYKIYIIDEVHMLSTAAFNALLKTLEEPPEHVMFIFATTEAHKIPATILSRCQRHDLGRIELALISDHLESLCSNEGFSIEEQSLDLISQEADGSIRDALSLLDRILSAGNTKTIDHQSVLDGLGILDQQIMHEVSESIFENNGTKLIEIIERINDSGIDLKKYYSDLILHFRNLNVVKLCGKDTTAANINNSEKEKIFQITSKLSSSYINTVLQVLLDEESLVRYSSHTKTAIEMVLLKLLRINPGAQIDQIINKLDVLTNQLNSKFPDTEYTQGAVKDPGAGQLSLPPKKIPQKVAKPLQQHGNDTTQKLASDQESYSQEPYNQESYIQEPYNQKPYNQKPYNQKPYNKTNGVKENSGQKQNVQEESSREKTWPGFLKNIEQDLPFMFTLLSKGIVKTKDDHTIIVELVHCSSFNKKRIESKKTQLQDRCKKFLGKQLLINIISDEKKTSNPENDKEKAKEIRIARQAAFNHPFVLEAKKIFDGDIISQ